MIWVWLSALAETVAGWFGALYPFQSAMDSSSFSTLNVVIPVPFMSAGEAGLVNQVLGLCLAGSMGGLIIRVLRSLYGLIPGCG